MRFPRQEPVGLGGPWRLEGGWRRSQRQKRKRTRWGQPAGVGDGAPGQMTSGWRISPSPAEPALPRQEQPPTLGPLSQPPDPLPVWRGARSTQAGRNVPLSTSPAFTGCWVPTRPGLGARHPNPEWPSPSHSCWGTGGEDRWVLSGQGKVGGGTSGHLKIRQ